MSLSSLSKIFIIFPLPLKQFAIFSEDEHSLSIKQTILKLSYIHKMRIIPSGLPMLFSILPLSYTLTTTISIRISSLPMLFSILKLSYIFSFTRPSKSTISMLFSILPLSFILISIIPSL